jgi:uncharacterized protein YecT (DUF1311 family)
MALIQCSECGQEISDLANSCPNCGFPLNDQQQNNVRQKTIIAIAIVIILAVLSWVYVLPKFLTNSGMTALDNNSSNSLQQVLPDSEAVKTVKNGILTEYPQITVSEAFDHYLFFNKTRWYEAGAKDGKKLIAVECSLDQEKLGSAINEEKQSASHGLPPTTLTNITINNDKLIFYFLLNSNNTFSFIGHDETVDINNEKTLIGNLGSEKGIYFFGINIGGYPLDLIYSNNPDRFYHLSYNMLLKKYLKNHPEFSIPTFSYSTSISDEDYKSLKKMSSAFSDVDQKMTQTYNKLFSSLSSDAKALLTDDQKQWVNQRDSEAMQFGKKGTQSYIDKLIQLTEKRTQELQAQL